MRAVEASLRGPASHPLCSFLCAHVLGLADVRATQMLFEVDYIGLTEPHSGAEGLL